MPNDNGTFEPRELETVLAKDTAAILDYLGRLLAAVQVTDASPQRPQWAYAATKADELQALVQRLREHLQPLADGKITPDQRPRPREVRRLIAWHGRALPLAQQLFPMTTAAKRAGKGADR